MTTAASDPTRGQKYGWIFAAIWLFYLAGPVSALFAQDNAMWRAIGLVAVTAFALTYLFVVRMSSIVRRTFNPPREYVVRASIGIAVMLALFLLMIPGAGATALSCLVYIAAFAMASLPLTRAIPFAALLAAERQGRLFVAQKEIADLAVQNERTRIAADLHDILGHSLTVVTVKAELAQRLLDVDLDRARKEIADLEGLARDALADVRSTAMGMRGISLPGEIAAAREALDAANMEASLPGAADEVPSRNRELFAWTIREAVTNIVRHSKAKHVSVVLAPASVEIVDDGIGVSSELNGQNGQGLAGLRRRAEALGAKLTVGGREGQQGFRVRVEVPS